METKKCSNCGCVMGAASEMCPVCGTVMEQDSSKKAVSVGKEEPPVPRHEPRWLNYIVWGIIAGLITYIIVVTSKTISSGKESNAISVVENSSSASKSEAQNSKVTEDEQQKKQELEKTIRDRVNIIYNHVLLDNNGTTDGREYLSHDFKSTEEQLDHLILRLQASGDDGYLVSYDKWSMSQDSPVNRIIVKSVHIISERSAKAVIILWNGLEDKEWDTVVLDLVYEEGNWFIDEMTASNGNGYPEKKSYKDILKEYGQDF